MFHCSLLEVLSGQGCRLVLKCMKSSPSYPWTSPYLPIAASVLRPDLSFPECREILHSIHISRYRYQEPLSGCHSFRMTRQGHISLPSKTHPGLSSSQWYCSGLLLQASKSLFPYNICSACWKKRKMSVDHNALPGILLLHRL